MSITSIGAAPIALPRATDGASEARQTTATRAAEQRNGGFTPPPAPTPTASAGGVNRLA